MKIRATWFLPGHGAHIEFYDTDIASDRDAMLQNEALGYPVQYVVIHASEAAE